MKKLFFAFIVAGVVICSVGVLLFAWGIATLYAYMGFVSCLVLALGGIVLALVLALLVNMLWIGFK